MELEPFPVGKNSCSVLGLLDPSVVSGENIL